MNKKTASRNLLTRTQKLLDKVRAANREFEEKTLRTIESAEDTIGKLKRSNLDKELGWIEQEAVKVMQETVLEHIGNIDELDKEESLL